MADMSEQSVRRAWPVFLLLAIYFLINILVRISLPSSLELDEAEQVFYSQWLALGYGPQPPLYNWLQVAVFALTGKSLLGLSLLKNLLLFLSYLFYWLAARHVLKDGTLRLVAVLGLMTLPQVSFMAEQDLAHTVALIAMTSLFLYAFYRILDRADTAGYAVAGLAIGLGFLAKYNFALLPIAALLAILPERDLRDRMINWRLLLAVAIAVAIVLPHLAWLAGHLDLATAQTLNKMTEHGAPEVGLGSALRGLVSLVVAIIAFSVVTAVIFAAIYRSRTLRVLRAQSLPIRVTERMLVLLLAALVLIVVGTGATEVRERWLDPFLMVLPLYLAMKAEAAGAADSLEHRGLLAIPLIIMVAVPASIFLRVATTPLTGAYTRLNIPMDRFVESVVRERGAEPSVVIAGDRRLAGNIALQLPAVPVMTLQFPDFVLPFSASAAHPILLAWPTSAKGGTPEGLGQWLSANAGGATPEIKTIVLPYHYAKGADSYSFSYAWVSLASQ